MELFNLIIVFLVSVPHAVGFPSSSCQYPSCPTCPYGYHHEFTYSGPCKVCHCNQDHSTTKSTSRDNPFPPPPNAIVSIRLVNQFNDSHAGRVEALAGGTWGTVCDDNFDQNAAKVICRQLGYPYANAVTTKSFGSGSGQIWLDQINCQGNENSLESCGHNPLGTNDCTHKEDIGVICQSDFSSFRLVNPSKEPLSGRVEVLAGGHWGTLCEDNTNQKAARVICRQMGYPYTDAVTTTSFGPGTGRIWSDQIVCQGNESSLLSCGRDPTEVKYCNHGDDVGVVCQSGPIQVRLVGSMLSEGRLEIHYDGVWRTICDPTFNTAAADVACRMLGFQDSRSHGSGVYGHGSGPVMADKIDCNGTEYTMAQCSFQPSSAGQCGHNGDVGVACQDVPTTPCSDLRLRLVRGSSSKEGRLEMLRCGVWGTICDDKFNDAAATVACRMLGLPTPDAVALGDNYFGPGSGPIWLDEVSCHGNESTLENCAHQPWGDVDCGHSEDVGISCATEIPSSIIKVRLKGGLSDTDGRLEILRNGLWGTVCDDSFTDASAAVACRMLRLPTSYAVAYANAHYGEGFGRIWLDEVFCQGNESSLVDCAHQPWGITDCGHAEDVSVSCSAVPTTSGYSIRLRLAGGNSSSEGRLEVLHEGVWGTICDDRFNAAAATVACRMLGLPTSHAVVYGTIHFGQGSGKIWLDDLACLGSESSLIHCAHNSWGVQNCAHKEDVGISCSGTVSSIRLAGGQTKNEGRLEIFHDGVWGTICDDQFSDASATVACRMLGLPTSYAVAYANAHYGQGSGRIWLDNVFCKGNESTLADCPHLAWGTTNCNHKEDVGVSCPAVSTTPSSELRVRLAGGPSSSEGRLEIFHNGAWGTVCDDSFTDASAAVACRMLGLPITNAVSYAAAHFGEGTGRIWLDDLYCTGSESSLTHCAHQSWGIENCDHKEDVGIACRPSGPPDIHDSEDQGMSVIEEFNNHK